MRAVLLGSRREGKSDLLAQIKRLLFESAEGPLPFWFRFEALAPGDAAAAARLQALRFAASFCQQMRAFLLRQDEILLEPPGELAAEMERPGIPLSLSELTHELLATAPSATAAELASLASRLPARFAHREGRPVCHLWDDCHFIDSAAPYLAALDASSGIDDSPSRICSLLTGHAPAMRSLAGKHSWTAIQLQPFATSEALLLAESLCKSSGVRFNREVWECWFAASSTSPGWAAPLIESAALRGEPIESVEQLGRLYTEDLDNGSIGTWLVARWPLPAAMPTLQEARPLDIARQIAHGTADSFAVSPAQDTAGAGAAEHDVAGKLDQNEWLRLRALSVDRAISPVEADWLRLEASRATIGGAAGGARAQARILQQFLLRVQQLQHAQQTSDDATELSLDAIEEHLLYPPAPDAATTTAAGDTIRLPKIHSVVRESTAEGEMFWSFGQTVATKGTKKAGTSGNLPAPTVPVVLLLVHAAANPTKAMVVEWLRRLQQETLRPEEAAGSVKTELWVVVPSGGTLAPTTGERRLTRETLSNLLTAVAADAPGGAPSSNEGLTGEAAQSDDSTVQDIGKRLTELQARAQWLQREFKATQKDTAPAAQRSLASSADTPIGAETPIPPQRDRRNEYLRQALSLSLMLASADLAATGGRSSAATAEARNSLADLQVQCQQLLDALHERGGQTVRPSTASKTPSQPR